MTGPNERDEIAWMVHRSCGCGPTVGFDGKPGPICEPDREDWAAADAILDWLAERDRRTAAAALREAADELAPRASSDEPCDNAEDCCGSADSCDAIRPMRRLVGESWLRDRAERIERGE